MVEVGEVLREVRRRRPVQVQVRAKNGSLYQDHLTDLDIMGKDTD